MQVHFKVMEAVHSSRSSFDEAEHDFKLEIADNATSSSDPETSTATAEGESSVHQVSHPQVITKTKGETDDEAMVLRRKVDECGLWDMRVPELQMPECSSDGQETESDEADDDLCSSSDDDSEESFNPLASGIMPPVLPDVQLRVPMDNKNDVRRVKEALLIKGVVDVVCDEERQIVTVTGVVPPVRLLKKVRQVKRQARILSNASPFSMFVNPSTPTSSHFAVHEDQDSAPISIPSAHPGIPNFVVRQQRPRPAFQRYNFHNDPHSPYLRTFSPTDLSPAANSPSPVVTAHHTRFESPSLDDDSYQANGFIFT